jgi:hypothetical protein
MPRIESQEFEWVDISTLQRDPELHPQIWESSVNQRDEIKCAYLKANPYRFTLFDNSEYLFLGTKKKKNPQEISIILV